MHLETERLILRLFTKHDFELFASLMGDPEVMRFSLNGPIPKEKALGYFQKRIIDHYVEHGYGLYAVEKKENRKFIGFVGLINQSIDQQNWIELAYRLYPAYWGQGFATEAALAVCKYAFEKLNRQKLISIIDPQNRRSLQVAKRVGMSFWKETIFHGLPVHLYQLIKPS
jgi:ribosomal-protein-alanine N-acetyltransferase